MRRRAESGVWCIKGALQGRMLGWLMVSEYVQQWKAKKFELEMQKRRVNEEAQTEDATEGQSQRKRLLGAFAESQVACAFAETQDDKRAPTDFTTI